MPSHVRIGPKDTVVAKRDGRLVSSDPVVLRVLEDGSIDAHHGPASVHIHLHDEDGNDIGDPLHVRVEPEAEPGKRLRVHESG